MYPQSMFLSKNKKKCHIFIYKNIIFSTFKNCFILHGHVFVMQTVKTEEDGRQLMMKRCMLHGMNIRYFVKAS